ncbi:uncharacterized protein C8R40DRAFT_1178526 [Lentinula edodes]|uniref:uncharacterized protein n=1 Tax=Lentinula edodes TaxID=5353 RepID=UPI001E8E7998|nr:uncharacterized protein C8R40DRAFT_1178526 [Lentinula edodes]KAH7867861.1 hypothetical protein C8R40DRAFT_1178526 [Lentinula edodes]
MEKIFLGVISGATESEEIVLCVRAILDFIEYSQFSLHTDESLEKMDEALRLEKMDEALRSFHSHKDAAFVDTGIRQAFNIPKILLYHYFTRQCNQDLAYSRRFLELHGTPAHCATWGIPLDIWHQYDAALHEHTSSTSTFLELNMLDEQDEVDAVQLATIAEAHSGLAHQLVSPPAPQMPIKGGESDIFTSNMPPTPCSMLVPRILTAHPDKTMPTGQ